MRSSVVFPHSCRPAPARPGCPADADSHRAKPDVNARIMKKFRRVDRFTETQMFKLVKIYKEYSCLWDIRHKSYRDRFVRENAYKEICDKLNIPGMTVKDVPRKIKNLRSSYFQEIKRIDTSIKEGATGGPVYIPKVSWFEMADGYLKTGMKIQNDDLERRLQRTGKDSTQDTNENLDTIAGNVFRLNQTNFIPEPHQNVTQDLTEDEFDSFGKYVASSLRSMDRETSIIAKMELQNTLARVQLRFMRQSNPSIQPTPCSTSTCIACEDPLEL